MKNFVIYSLLFLSACASSAHRQEDIREILLRQKVSTKKVLNLTSDHINEDIGILIFTLENAYGGKKVLPGTQYSSLLKSLDELKSSSEIVSSDQLCDKLGEIFDKVNDYHNTVKIEERLCGRIWPRGTVGLNSGAGEKNRTWSFLLRQYNQKIIPVLSLKTMSPDTSADWKGFLEKVQELITAKTSFIIDLRGNGGGNPTHSVEMARLLYGLDQQQELPWPKKQVFHLQTRESWALIANYYWLSMQKDENKEKAKQEDLLKGYEKFVKLSRDAQSGLMAQVEIQNLGGGSPDLTGAVTSPIYLLIDRGCGSACEGVLEALERLPSIYTVGERTTGVVQYGYPGWLYLPASHIIVQLSTQATSYGDNRQVEKIGYAPRWSVPTGTDALAFTLEKFFK